MVRRYLLIATSIFFTCGLLLQTEAQYSAARNTRACVEIRSVLAEAPQVVQARRRMSETLDVTFPATSDNRPELSRKAIHCFYPRPTGGLEF